MYSWRKMRRSSNLVFLTYYQQQTDWLILMMLHMRWDVSTSHFTLRFVRCSLHRRPSVLQHRWFWWLGVTIVKIIPPAVKWFVIDATALSARTKRFGYDWFGRLFGRTLINPFGTGSYRSRKEITDSPVPTMNDVGLWIRSVMDYDSVAVYRHWFYSTSLWLDRRDSITTTHRRDDNHKLTSRTFVWSKIVHDKAHCTCVIGSGDKSWKHVINK
jgi:hypothetical protein